MGTNEAINLPTENPRTHDTLAGYVSTEATCKRAFRSMPQSPWCSRRDAVEFGIGGSGLSSWTVRSKSHRLRQSDWPALCSGCRSEESHLIQLRRSRRNSREGHVCCKALVVNSRIRHRPLMAAKLDSGEGRLTSDGRDAIWEMHLDYQKGQLEETVIPTYRPPVTSPGNVTLPWFAGTRIRTCAFIRARSPKVPLAVASSWIIAQSSAPWKQFLTSIAQIPRCMGRQKLSCGLNAEYAYFVLDFSATKTDRLHFHVSLKGGGRNPRATAYRFPGYSLSLSQKRGPRWISVAA